MFVQIDENKNLIRDTTNRAILNTDRAGLESYLAQRQIAKQRLAEQEEIKNALLNNDTEQLRKKIEELQDTDSKLEVLQTSINKMKTTDSKAKVVIFTEYREWK